MKICEVDRTFVTERKAIYDSNVTECRPHIHTHIPCVHANNEYFVWTGTSNDMLHVHKLLISTHKKMGLYWPARLVCECGSACVMAVIQSILLKRSYTIKRCACAFVHAAIAVEFVTATQKHNAWCGRALKPDFTLKCNQLSSKHHRRRPCMPFWTLEPRRSCNEYVLHFLDAISWRLPLNYNNLINITNERKSVHEWCMAFDVRAGMTNCHANHWLGCVGLSGQSM